LERYAADFALEGRDTVSQTIPHTLGQEEKRSGKIAVVGSGPAGLTCAADLAKLGYEVVLFESLHLAGGVLSYGIPEFRLPKEIVRQEVAYIQSLGVKLCVDSLVGRTYTLDGLFSGGFKAIFVAVGAGLPKFLGIVGEHLNGVYSANEFLTRINLMRAYNFPEYATPVKVGKTVAVIGGGNVALDSARVALRLGGRVTIVYRRTDAEMPGRREEVENALEEGVAFRFLTQPVALLGDEKGFVKGLECITMELGEPDESGRRRPLAVRGSNFILDVDTVVIAIGQDPNPLVPHLNTQIQTTARGTIIVDENLMTTLPGVFAGGDIITGADTVIQAMGAGKKAAVSIDRYVRGKG
jgi:glutamate synthase (NADPH/NADH) small chain